MQDQTLNRSSKLKEEAEHNQPASENVYAVLPNTECTQELRSQIHQTKDKDQKEYEKQKRFLAEFYLSEKVPGFSKKTMNNDYLGYFYDEKELQLYLDDYFLREVDAVLDFFQRHADYINPEVVVSELDQRQNPSDKSQNGKQEISETPNNTDRYQKLAQLMATIKQTSQYKYVDFYIDDEKLKTKSVIAFNIKAADMYLKDFLAQFIGADGYVLNLVDKDPSKFIEALNKIKKEEDFDQICKFVMTQRKDNTDLQKRIDLLKTIRPLSTVKGSIALAEYLMIACDDKLISLDQLIEMVSLLNLTIVEKTAVFSELHKIFPDHEKYDFQEMLFNYALSNEAQTDQLTSSCYSEALNKLMKDREPSSGLFLRSHAPLDYYVASVNFDKDSLLKLATNTPKIFSELFSKELEFRTGFKKNRITFYCDLLNFFEANNAKVVQDCVKAFNDFIKFHKDELPYTIGSSVNVPVKPAVSTTMGSSATITVKPSVGTAVASKYEEINDEFEDKSQNRSSFFGVTSPVTANFSAEPVVPLNLNAKSSASKTNSGWNLSLPNFNWNIFNFGDNKKTISSSELNKFVSSEHNPSVFHRNETGKLIELVDGSDFEPKERLKK